MSPSSVARTESRADARLDSSPVTLAWVLAFAMSVRILYALGAWLLSRDASVFYGMDSGSYITPARELLSHGTFTNGGRPELQRTPGFPLMLVPGVWLGYLTLTTIALNILLSTSTVGAVYLLARRVFTEHRIAVTAAVLYAVEPLSVGYVAAISTETLFTAIVTWALVPVVGYIRDRRPSLLLLGMAMLAAAAYVRPVGYFLPFALLLLLGLVALLRRTPRQLPHLALAAVLTLGILLPWELRNRRLGFPGFSAVSAVNMYFYNGAAVRAAVAGTSFARMQAEMGFGKEEVYLRNHPEQRTWRPGERFEYMGHQGTRLVREHLRLYAGIHLKGMMRVLLDPGAIDLLKTFRLYPMSGGLLDRIVTNGLGDALRHLFREHPVAAFSLVGLGLVLLAIYAAALRGLLTNRHFTDPTVVLLVGVIAYFVVISGGPGESSRFRHPVMPLVCVLAAAGVHARRQRAGGQSAAPTGTLADRSSGAGPAETHSAASRSPNASWSPAA